MDLMKAVGVIYANVDEKTGAVLTHEEIYGRVIDLLGGLEVVANYLPFSLEYLREAYKRDPNFNNTPLRKWDRQAGFITEGSKCIFAGDGLWWLYRKHRITSASCADGVCILKEAAKRLIERKEVGGIGDNETGV